ncbi:MAG: winged helix-turn-helix domain-containing protein [Methylococcales bacterium]|nr:winged helix-turn-helix domain-containing protein [Methylococcales bacterium]
MTDKKIKLLLIEDDVRLAELIRDYIEQQGFQVKIQYRGDRAVAEFNPQLTDIVILDLMLPGLDGLQVCQQIRQTFDGPILILTAKNSDIDHVMGLELGADDFVTKPIEPPVLLARLRALIRRDRKNTKLIETTKKTTELHFGTLFLNQKAQQVSLQKINIELTTQEFYLLWLLAENAGKILSRDQIFTHIRGIEYDGLDRSVDVRISHLRKKLQDHSEQPKRLKTVWGKGYLFVADAWE